MSMITGCPACGTMFRVVPDQLKISEGWVRCGHCSEVFDASAHLQDDEALAVALGGGAAVEDAQPDVPFEGDTMPVPPEPAAPEAGQEPEAGAATDPSVRAQLPGEGVADAFRRYAEEERARTPSPFPSRLPPPPPAPVSEPAAETVPAPLPEAYRTAPEPEPDDFDLDFRQAPAGDLLRRPSELPASVPAMDEHGYLPVEVLRREAEASVPARPGSPEVPLDEPDLDDVSFVQQARRKAFWRRPLVRFALFLLALALGALLAGQYAYQERDRLAATHPALRPALEQLCFALDCRLGPPRRIDAVVIDSSTFTRVRPDTYRLSFTVRNQAQQPVAVPSLELTLTDSQDQAVVRRVLAPRDLTAPADTLAPASDWSGAVTIAVEGQGGRVAGYRLLAFYP